MWMNGDDQQNNTTPEYNHNSINDNLTRPALLFIRLPQRPQDLPVYRPRQNRGNRIANLLPDLPRSKPISHGKCLQARKLAVGESSSAGRVIVHVTTSTGHRSGRLVGVERDSAPVPQSPVQGTLDIMVQGARGDTGDDGIDGLQSLETGSRESMGGLWESWQSFSGAAKTVLATAHRNYSREHTQKR